ncbi:MAG: hypothetical protein DRI32_04605 [Chloroflexi bacterium]|nr:MAG: hypothetical protein DRI32_04605 [Chloroflexota bacterium]
MDFENIYAVFLIGAGIFSLTSAVQGKSIEASDTPRLSKRTSALVYGGTGILLIIFGIMRLN